MAVKTGKEKAKSGSGKAPEKLGVDLSKVGGKTPVQQGTPATPGPVADPQINANAPTTVTAAEAEVTPQKIVVDPNKVLTDPRVDTILLIDQLEPTRKRLAEAVKVELLKAGAKFAKGEQGEAQLKLANPGSEIDPALLLAALVEKNKVLKGLRQPEIDFAKLVAIGAVSFDKKVLASILTGEEIAAVSVVTPARAPSMTVDEIKGQPAITVLTALERLTGVALKEPKIFEEPPKEPKKK